MANQDTTSLPDLFKQWRGGDGNAGQEMARRFSDWYYAITVSRLGENEGRDPLQRSCDRFAREIVKLNSASQLMDWAQGIIRRELEQAGNRISGGDFPNALTDRRSPTELLQSAWSELPRQQLVLLDHAYNVDYDLDTLVEEAEEAGGFPIALLRARLSLKRWLRDARGVPLAVVPDEPNLDCAPMPIYEAGRMTAENEEARFERWMLSRFELCRDVAEFAVFSLAMRSGALHDAPPPDRAAPVAAPSAPQEPAPSAAPARAQPAPAGGASPADSKKPSGGTMVRMIVLGGIVVMLVLTVLLGLLWRFVL